MLLGWQITRNAGGHARAETKPWRNAHAPYSDVRRRREAQAKGEAMSREAGLYWHVYHERLFEWCWDVEERWKHIKDLKPPEEVETRLRLMQPVKGTLGGEEAFSEYKKALAEHSKVVAEYDEVDAKAGAEYEKAHAEYTKAFVEYTKAWDAWISTIRPGDAEALHAIECPNCPWNGKTIFPEVK